MNSSVIVGLGEVGRAHFNILRKTYAETYAVDLKPTGYEPPPRLKVDVLHIATPFVEDYVDMVVGYADKFRPSVISILTTVVPGTCRRIESIAGVQTFHSTTRGLHPNLEDGLRTIDKHIGGAPRHAVEYFDRAGFSTVTHMTAETTEVAHLLMNLEYAVNLAFADEAARVCRMYGVDFVESVLAYKQTYNDGFHRLGHDSKRRMIVTPPNGRIGGHCLVQNAEMLYPELEKAGVAAPMIKIIKDFNTR